MIEKYRHLRLSFRAAALANGRPFACIRVRRGANRGRGQLQLSVLAVDFRRPSRSALAEEPHSVAATVRRTRRIAGPVWRAGVPFRELSAGRALPSAERMRGGYSPRADLNQSNRLITTIRLVSSPAQPLLARAYHNFPYPIARQLLAQHTYPGCFR
jgi:hypothetical protein